MFTLFAFAMALHTDGVPEATDQQAQSHERDAKQYSPPPGVDNSKAESARRNPSAAHGQYACQEGVDCSEKALLTQRHIAEATHDLALAAREQQSATFWGNVLLLATVIAAFGGIGVAYRANSLARRNAMQQLRAYVSLVPAGLWYDKTFVAYVAQKNNGQTPAQKARFSGKLVKLPYPLPRGFEFSASEFEGVNVIGPGQQFRVDIVGEEPFSLQDISASEMNGTRLYVIGVLTYFDAFGEERKTIACWSFPTSELQRVWDEASRRDPTLEADAPKPVAVEFAYTEEHNDAT